METHYHLPVRPYSPIDALNRRAAALGSPRYAAGASHADYNGHHVTVSFNDYRNYYIAQYFWAGPVTLARGLADRCVEAAIANYDHGALGASVEVSLSDCDVANVLQSFPQLVLGRCEFRPAWHTWQHECAAASARDYANPQAAVMFFDWTLMQAATDRTDYENALRAKYGRIYQQ